MARIARPTSDIRNTGWSYTGSFTSISGVLSVHPATDTDSAGSVLDPTTADYGEVLLSAIADPFTSSKHYLRVGIVRSNINRTMDCEFRLMQGATQIATRTITGLSITIPRYFCWELTGAETDAITNYANLSVRCIPTFTGGVTSTRAQWLYCEFYAAESFASRVYVADSDDFERASIGANWDFQIAYGTGAAQLISSNPVIVSGNVGASQNTDLAICYRVDHDYPADEQFSEAVVRTPYTDADQRQSVFVFWTDNPDLGISNFRVDFQYNIALLGWELKLTGILVGVTLGTTAGSPPLAADVIRLEGRWNPTLSRVDYIGTLKRGVTLITTTTGFDATGSRIGRPGMALRAVTAGATNFASWTGGSIDLIRPRCSIGLGRMGMGL